ncbi:uncharacterized protein DUF3304 [Pseudomonas sp. SJZ080]|nr:uncharacterized protein DUF3304 [Pseudomonas sp. SJZ080]
MPAHIKTGISARMFARFMTCAFLPWPQTPKFNNQTNLRFANIFIFLTGLLVLSGCQAESKMLSAPITGYNHTSAAINRFTVNGAGGPNLGPQLGGGAEVCCGVLPRIWTPGLKAIVEWQTDPNPHASATWTERPYSDAWRKRMSEKKQKYSNHRSVVEIPQYGEQVCALQVHFLPCDQVRVSTTCLTPSNENYPDKAYFQVKEPASCLSR